MINRAYVAIALLAFLPGAFAQGLADPEQVRTELEACMEVDDARRGACTDAVLQRIPEETEEDVALQAAFQEYQHEIAAALARSGEPRKLALAAVLETMSGFEGYDGEVSEDGRPSIAPAAQAQANAWRAAAGERAGQDVIANILLMFGDAPSDSAASRNAAAARWANAEPDNLAPLFYGDAGGDAILAASAQSSRFDIHAYDTVRWLRQTFAAQLPPPAEWVEAQGAEFDLDTLHAMQSMTLWSAVALPSFHSLEPLSETCRGYVRGASTQRRAACRQVAQALADASDTLLGQLVGIKLLEDAAGTPEERAEAHTRRRRFDWRMQQWTEVSSRLRNAGSSDFARLLGDPGIYNEEQLMLRQLREAGVALDPPAGWQPPRRE